MSSLEQVRKVARSCYLFLMDTDHYYQVTDRWDKQITTWATDGAPLGETATWPLSRLGDALTIVFAYLAFVFFALAARRCCGCGKKPIVNLYPIKFVYNFVQVVLCSYMSVEAFLLAKRNNYSISIPCNVYDAADPKIANLLWIFYMSKILDFFDTIAIILGGKWKQLSFLHIYHHATIFMFYWLDLKAYYDGDIFLTIMLNAFVHAVMYNYYFITMQIPRLPQNGKPMFTLWWKKYITQVQMVQFLLMIAQAITLWHTSCKHMHKNIVVVYLFYIASLLALFFNFYLKSYFAKGKRKQKKR